MARLKLQTKEKSLQKINRVEGKSLYISVNDPSNFALLKDNRCEDEKFTRVDKFIANHYYLVGTEWLKERIFYPSWYGFEEINKEKDHPYKKMCKLLIETGVGLYGKRPLPKINKPTKRLELKCKPKRMTLSCKEK